jgi:hypothetical protein
MVAASKGTLHFIPELNRKIFFGMQMELWAIMNINITHCKG